MKRACFMIWRGRPQWAGDFHDAVYLIFTNKNTIIFTGRFSVITNCQFIYLHTNNYKRNKKQNYLSDLKCIIDVVKWQSTHLQVFTFISSFLLKGKNKPECKKLWLREPNFCLVDLEVK